jgi:hypothetical protein
MMPTESLSSSELHGKRKLKNKMPKRLRRRNKENNINADQYISNNVPSSGNNLFKLNTY